MILVGKLFGDSLPTRIIVVKATSLRLIRILADERCDRMKGEDIASLKNTGELS